MSGMLSARDAREHAIHAGDAAAASYRLACSLWKQGAKEAAREVAAMADALMQEAGTSTARAVDATLDGWAKEAARG